MLFKGHTLAIHKKYTYLFKIHYTEYYVTNFIYAHNSLCYTCESVIYASQYLCYVEMLGPFVIAQMLRA